MITIRCNPKALNNDGQIKKVVPFIEGHSIIFYVQMNDFPYKDVSYILSGKAKCDPDTIVKDGDEIIIVPEVRGPILAAIGAFLWAAITVHPIITAIVALTLAYSVYSALTNRQRAPSFGNGADGTSPTYGWDGIQNTADVSLPVPVIYGQHRVGGQIIGEYVSVGSAITIGGGTNPEVDDNYLNVLIALCEGPIDSVNNIEINGNPMSNFSNVATQVNLGNNTQVVIPNFQQVHDLRSFAVQFTSGIPQVYTTYNAVDALEIHILLQNGLYSTDATSGAIGSESVTLLVEYKLHSSGTWLTYGTTTYSDTIRTAGRFIIRLDSTNVLSANGIYDVRITKTSADSTFYNITDTTWDTTDEILNQALQYPNTVLLAVTALATNQLSGSTPTFTSEVRGKLISTPNILHSGSPVTWDNYCYDESTAQYKLLSDGTTVLTWDGTTYISAFSANPIWCLYDLLTNTRYGLGQFISTSMIDMTSFLAMSQYCEQRVSDGAGGYEKFLRLDIVLDQGAKAMDMIVQICSTFRCLIYYSGGTIKVKIDQAGSAVQLFTMANIISGGFSQSWMPIKDRYNMIEVQFNNIAIDYQNDTLEVVDEAALAAGAPMRKKSLRMYCTHASQAYREGQFLLWVNKYISRMATIKVDIDAICCEAGDIIDISHDVPQWGIGSGRVQPSSSTTVINLQNPITLPSGTNAITIRHKDDTIEERTISTSAGVVSQVTVSVAFTSMTAYDVYTIGAIGVETKPFRIVNIKYNADFTAEITAIEYNASIYSLTAAQAPPQYSALSFDVPTVTDLNLTQGQYIAPDGTTQISIDVWFNPPDNTDVYVLYDLANVFLSDDGGASWTYVGQATGSSFRIETPIKVGNTYRVAIQSQTATGSVTALGSSPQQNITISFSVAAPANVSGFSYSWGDVLTLLWVNNTEANLAGYEIRDADTNWGVENSNLIYRGKVNKVVLYPAGRSVGTYYIRAFNTVGGYSLASVSVTPTVTAPSAPSGLSSDVLFNVANIFWTDTGSTNNLYYEVWRSYTNAWAGEEILVQKVSGKSCTLVSRAPASGQAASGSVTTLVDPALIGFGTDFFVGCTLTITNGTGGGHQAVITAFNSTTGTLTFASFGIAIDSTSLYNLTDNCYIKVRGVDQYGQGSFSTALYIQYQNLSSNSFGDSVITARNIYVACLSALSANLGCVTAGTLQGATIQTASGGARTIIDTVGLHSYDASCNLLADISSGAICLKSAAGLAYTSFDAFGISTYDSSGCLNARICNGSLYFVNPACSAQYTCLVAGALQFHDAYGNVPYTTRMCSGFVATGGIVCLPGWVNPPNVLVSIRSLQSFNSAAATSCQCWTVYSDSPVCWCHSSTDYGWCFVAHACLQTSSSTGAACVRSLCFGNLMTSGVNVCGICFRNQFQLWCNPACANYCYGCLVYNICYQCVGAGAWCCCTYTFIQAHGNLSILQSCQDDWQYLALPCGACWNFIMCCVSLGWTDSGIASGATLTCTCALAQCIPTCTINSSCCECCSPNFSYSTSRPATWTPANLGGSWSLYATVNGAAATYAACLCVRTPSGSFSSSCACISYGSVLASMTGTSGPLCCYVGGTGSGDSTLFLCSHNTSIGWWCYQYCVCMAQCTRTTCYCCTYCSGTAGSCTYAYTYTTQDTYATSCVLDPAGCLNWLAMAY